MFTCKEGEIISILMRWTLVETHKRYAKDWAKDCHIWKNYEFSTFDAKYHLGTTFGICNLEDSRIMHSPSFEGFISLLRVYVSKFTMVFYANLLWDCKFYRKLNLKSRVKLPIKELILITQHFSIFSSFYKNWAIFVSLDTQTKGP
jgi:hypothetical protein